MRKSSAKRPQSDPKEKRKSNKGFLVLCITLGVIFLGGAAMFLYPYFANRWNDFRNRQLIRSYEKVYLTPTDEEARLDQEAFNAALQYNREHKANTIVDAFENGTDGDAASDSLYWRLLNRNGDGMMGYISIPKIGQQIPIYHGTSDVVLNKGVGHMEGTSLPVGGTGSHSALAAHRGLPGLKLFSDLDQIEEGDLFYLHILGRVLAYQVDQVLVVLPDATETLDIAPGRDLCTLVTCTPYGINTHRLLVRGTRIPYTEEVAQQEMNEKNVVRSDQYYLIAIAVIAAVVVAGIAVVRKAGRTGKERTQEKASPANDSDEGKDEWMSDPDDWNDWDDWSG